MVAPSGFLLFALFGSFVGLFVHGFRYCRNFHSGVKLYGSNNSLAARVVVFGCIPLALVGGGVQPLYFLRVSPIKP